MQKLVTILSTAGVLSFAALANVSGAPIAGFESLYSTLITACSLPAGTVADCEVAINSYAGAIVDAVSLESANASFSEARAEVFSLNASDEPFQAEIDALFELLLPNSGAIGDAPVSLAPTGTAGSTGGSESLQPPVPASP
jgi:hypothetical protein